MNAISAAHRHLVDPVILARAVRRAKWRLLPFLILMYLLSYLDRANIGYAKQMYQQSTGVTDAAFAFGAGVFFLTYAAFEVPSNLILYRVGTRVWMTRIMVTWGLVAAAMVFATSDTSFSAIRLLLGAAEAGFFPGAILYMTHWFPAKERSQVLGYFYFGSPLALMLGGPLSGALLDLDGLFGLAGWQLMFLVEGFLASAVGVWAYFYLTDRPADAAWMPEDEREALSRAVAAEEREKMASGKIGFGAVLRDPRLLHFAAIYFLIQISGYGVAFYLPTQVSALLGMKIGLEVGLVSAIPWACAIAAGLFWPGLASRTGYRRSFAVVSLLGITGGLVIAANATPAIAIAALCVVTMGIITAQPIFWTFPTGYLGGAAAAGGIAVINAIGNLGGFFAPNVKTAVEAAFHSTAAGLYVLASSALLAAILVTAIRHRVSAKVPTAARPAEA
ncbi:MAG TPA: MFS transporter [Stellaceae bacterium]|nr:MFS transporter [Stellaceae bacterium]